MNNDILHNFNPIYINDIEASFTSKNFVLVYVIMLRVKVFHFVIKS